MLEKICGMSCLLTMYYEFFENTLEKDIKERNSNNIIVKIVSINTFGRPITPKRNYGSL